LKRSEKKDGAGEIMTCIFCFVINHYNITAATWLWSPWQPQRYQLNVWFNTFDKSIAVEQTHIFIADFSLLYECDVFIKSR
jgi:hypothetical protein